MALPLSAALETSLNSSTSPGGERLQRIPVTTSEQGGSMSGGEESSEQVSSPFLSMVDETRAGVDRENAVPANAARHSRVISGTELSPLKILTEQRSASPDVGTRRPRKVAADKRFPVKICSGGNASKTTNGSSHGAGAPDGAATKTERRGRERAVRLVEETVQLHEGPKPTIRIFEDEQGALVDKAEDTMGGPDEEGHRDGGRAKSGDDDDDDDDTTGRGVMGLRVGDADEAAGPNDTMVSTLSTFSAIPDMMMLAKFGHQSPGKGPASLGRLSDAATTNLLLDLTETMRFPTQSPVRRGPTTTTTPPRRSAAPHRHLHQQLPAQAQHLAPGCPGTPANLIDLDVGPLATPRSVPSITARELESLKSSLLSEISSLTAAVSGKTAEVQSLKAAVGDAEARVGQSLEQLREARGLRDQTAAERDGWQARARELDALLCRARREAEEREAEHEGLERKLEESDKRREAAEMLLQEAESKIAGMRGAGSRAPQSSASLSKAGSDEAAGDEARHQAASRDVEAAVERVARELHVLYKSKHETKVVALKKSYEARWDKQVRAAEARAADLAGDKARLARDAAETATRQAAAATELRADVRHLEAAVAAARADTDELRRLLDAERWEKGELVRTAEEMMSMQQSFLVGAADKEEGEEEEEKKHDDDDDRERDANDADDARWGEAARPGQARRRQLATGTGVARTPRPADGAAPPCASGLRAPHERIRSGGGGLPRPGGAALRSGIMTSIERMGNYRGGGRAD